MTLASNAMKDMLEDLQRRVVQLERSRATGSKIDYFVNYEMSVISPSFVEPANGWYIRINDLVIWSFGLEVGLGVGEGYMYIPCPFPISVAGGRWTLYSGTDITSGDVVNSSTANIRFQYPATYPTDTPTYVTHTTPVALTGGELLGGFVVGRAYYGRTAP